MQRNVLPKCCYQMRIGYITYYNTPDNLRISLEENLIEISAKNSENHDLTPHTEIGRVNSHSLSSIHSRYAKVLQVIDDNRCSMANAFRLAGCPRSTVRDFVKRYTDNLTTRKIREGLGLGFTFPIWQTEI